MDFVLVFMVDSLQSWIGKSSHYGDDFSDRARNDEHGRYPDGEEVQTGGF